MIPENLEFRGSVGKRVDLRETCAWMSLSFEGEGTFTKVVVDSRLAEPNALFFALPGDRVDGHQFLPDVAKRGVKFAVVSDSYSGENFGLTLLPSSNVLESLQAAARGKLANHCASIIAITGSLGKTTVKDFTHHLISQKKKTAKTPLNANSQIGLPLTIMNHIEADEEVLIFEMGMTLPKHISTLVSIAPPDIACVTCVAPVHMESFSSLEGIAHAKAEIFSHPKTRLGLFEKTIFAKELFQSAGNFCKKTFSISDSQADFTIFSDTHSLQFFEEGIHKATWPHLPVLGGHNLHNFAAAVAMAREVGCTFDEIRERIKTLRLPEKRLERVEKRGAIFINDSYNASKQAIEAALKTMPAASFLGKKRAVLSEMLGLGEFSLQLHEQVGQCALSFVDEVWCLGEGCLPIVALFEKEGKTAHYFESRDKLAEKLSKVIVEGDVVLIKGARDKEMWKVLDAL